MSRSFDILAAEYRPMVLSYLRALVVDVHLAEDLTQETFLAAQHNLDAFDSSRDFGAWLRGIARNKAKGDQRAAARHPVVVDTEIVAGMEEVYALFDQGPGPWDTRLDAVRQCVGQLNDNLRTAVVAVYGGADSLREAAEQLGVKFHALAQRISRARTKIRECVERSLPSTELTFHEEPSHVRSR